MWFWLGGSTKGAATDSSKELLAQLRQIASRPATDRNLTDAKGYLFLTAAQNALTYTLATHIPDVLKGAPELMTTADQGLTYATKADALAIEVYPALGQFPLIEGPYWDPRADYTREGPRTIRMQGNRRRTFPNGPWARYIKKPGVIDDITDPVIVPNDVRRVLPWLAAAFWAAAPNSGEDPAPYAAMVEKLLWGDPQSPGDVGIIGAYKVAHATSSLTGSMGLDLWTRSPDLGRTG